MKIRIGKQLSALGNRLRQRYLRSTLPESVYFITMHKCASSLFGVHVLKHVRGLEFRNYATDIYTGKVGPADTLEFRSRGDVYGPIRVSSKASSQDYKLLLEPLMQPDFLSDKSVVLMVRDPRDILVSAYYSFGFSHKLSEVEAVRSQQEKRREAILATSLDSYVLEAAEEQLEYFQRMERIRRDARNATLLRYCDMVENFDDFADRLEEKLPLEPGARARMYEQSRPQEKEDVSAHRRWGKVGGFRSKLEPGTIQELNEKLRPVLASFGYAD